MFEILPRDWNLKPIFTRKWVSVDMNWGVEPPPNPPDNSNPVYGSPISTTSKDGPWNPDYFITYLLYGLDVA